jgi:hypothetical protein
MQPRGKAKAVLGGILVNSWYSAEIAEIEWQDALARDR